MRIGNGKNQINVSYIPDNRVVLDKLSVNSGFLCYDGRIITSSNNITVASVSGTNKAFSNEDGYGYTWNSKQLTVEHTYNNYVIAQLYNKNNDLASYPIHKVDASHIVIEFPTNEIPQFDEYYTLILTGGSNAYPDNSLIVKNINTVTNPIELDSNVEFYKISITGNTAISFDTTSLTFENAAAVFELWIDYTSGVISFVDDVRWIGTTPEFSTAGIYFIEVRYDGTKFYFKYNGMN